MSFTWYLFAVTDRNQICRKLRVCKNKEDNKDNDVVSIENHCIYIYIYKVFCKWLCSLVQEDNTRLEPGDIVKKEQDGLCIFLGKPSGFGQSNLDMKNGFHEKRAYMLACFCRSLFFWLFFYFFLSFLFPPLLWRAPAPLSLHADAPQQQQLGFKRRRFWPKITAAATRTGGRFWRRTVCGDHESPPTLQTQRPQRCRLRSRRFRRWQQGSLYWACTGSVGGSHAWRWTQGSYSRSSGGAHCKNGCTACCRGNLWTAAIARSYRTDSRVMWGRGGAAAATVPGACLCAKHAQGTTRRRVWWKQYCE